MVTVKDFYEQNEDIRNEVIIAIQEQLPFPETLWEGYLSEVPEKFYDCEVVETGKSLKAAEEGITKYYLYISEAPKDEEEFPSCFYTRVEVEENNPVDNIAAWMIILDSMTQDMKSCGLEFDRLCESFIVRLCPDKMVFYNSGDEVHAFHLFINHKHMWEYWNCGIVVVDSSHMLRFLPKKKAGHIFLTLQEVKHLVPDEEFVSPECPPGFPFSEESEVE